VSLATDRFDRARVYPDRVRSYFAMRKVAVAKDETGWPYLMLNNHPVFMLGLLDQGFWPDGLYTAPTDEALRYDVEVTKRLGFNTIRKHVKVEPERWYYCCDSLGVLVWQDMPSGFEVPTPDRGSTNALSPECAKQFETELQRLVDARFNHPSIVLWVPFNEGWGQYDTQRIADWLRSYDPTRPVDSASGWTDVGAGNVRDLHAYPGPSAPPRESDRALVLGEFGGLGLAVPGHVWQEQANWGYRSFDDADALTAAYCTLLEQLRLLRAESGLSAAIYTQTTDVEIEVNGLLTYDRAIIKMDADRTAAAAAKLYQAPPVIRRRVPPSTETGYSWRYTLEKPAEGWAAPDFDDSGWPLGQAGFGRQGTPGITVRTDWHTGDIWLRRTLDVDSAVRNPRLELYHDEDCEVYLDGRRVAAETGYTTSYVFLPLSETSVLEPGRHVLAVHCRQTTGGQGVDVGVVEVAEE